MQTIDREKLKTKLDRDEDLALVEVLGPDQYANFHLPGAINVPIAEDFDERIQEVVPDRSTPVVVYCMDDECDASVKAARRLELLGYTEVYDYEPGKLDWKQAGLPVDN